MRLRLRFTLVLVIVNAVVLGALAWWASTDANQRSLHNIKRQRRYGELLAERLSSYFEPGAATEVADILAWDGWEDFEEVLVVDYRILDVDGQPVPIGAFLNPNGSRHRGGDFPLKQLTRSIAEASSTLKPVPVGGGMALPLIVREQFDSGPRKIWGGVYLRLRTEPLVFSMPMVIVLATLIATALSAVLMYLVLGRTVLRPVERLATAAEGFGQGKRLDLPGGRQAREIAGLMASFQTMMTRIQGFQQELELEVEKATEAAASSERRASRKDRLAAMGTLAAGLAHEINSPLAGALHGLETLRKEVSSERAQSHGELTADALHRIRELVQRLLQLAPSRIETGVCQAQRIFDDVELFLSSRLQTYRLEKVLPQQALSIAAAAGDLFPIILNLVQNACDSLDAGYTENGVISITAQVQGDDWVQIEVRDNGPGVAEDLLPQLFQPFQTTKDVGHGTGLGLALALATVRQLGGQIEARNLEPQGFAVTLKLPAAAPDHE
jgi:signal transduction histidine kinase